MAFGQVGKILFVCFLLYNVLVIFYVHIKT